MRLFPPQKNASNKKCANEQGSQLLVRLASQPIQQDLEIKSILEKNHFLSPNLGRSKDMEPSQEVSFYSYLSNKRADYFIGKDILKKILNYLDTESLTELYKFTENSLKNRRYLGEKKYFNRIVCEVLDQKALQLSRQKGLKVLSRFHPRASEIFADLTIDKINLKVKAWRAYEKSGKHATERFENSKNNIKITDHISNIEFQEFIEIEKNSQPIITCARNGDLEALKKALDRQDTSVNANSLGGFTALHLAAYNGHIDVLKHLLDQEDIDVDKVGKDDMTPILVTILSEIDSNVKATVVKMLCANRADVNAADREKRSMLMYAARRNELEVLRVLLDQDKIQVNAYDRWGRTALDWAKNYGNQEAFDLLCEKGGTAGDWPLIGMFKRIFR